MKSASGKKVEETEEISLHPNWIALIQYCGVALQNGTLSFITQASVPMGMLKPGTKEKVLFGKDSQKPLFVKEVDAAHVRIRITKKWSGLIKFCNQSFQYGQVCVEMAAGEPKRPVEKYTSADIRFDHPETFPPLVRFYNK